MPGYRDVRDLSRPVPEMNLQLCSIYVCLVAGQVTSIVLQACIYTVYANTCLKNVPHFVMLLRNVLVPLGLGQIEKPLAGGVCSILFALSVSSFSV